MWITQRLASWLAHAMLAGCALIVAANAGAAEIIVGQVAPLSGAEAKQGRSYAEGLQLAFALANSPAANSRHSFRLVSMDDKSQPAETVRATQQLLNEAHPLVLSGYVGGRGLTELLRSGVLDKGGAPIVGYRSAEVLAPHALLFGIRASLQEELEQMAKHLSVVAWRRVGLLYEQGSGSDALLALANTAAERAHISFVAKVAYDAARPGSLAQATQSLIAAAPQAIMVVASGSTTGAFVERYRGEGGKAHIFAQSNADIEQLTQRLGDEQLRGLVISQVTPNPYKVTTALSKALNNALRTKSNLAPGFTVMEGFIAGRVIVEAAHRLGGVPTRQAMVGALESLSALDLGGYTIAFSPGSHTGSRYVELSIVSGLGKVRQ